MEIAVQLAGILVPLVFLAVLAGIALRRLLANLSKSGADSEVGLRGRWGGFGGGRAGWQISPNLTLLFLTVVFGGAFVILGAYSIRSTRNSDADAKEIKSLTEKLKAIEERIDKLIEIQKPGCRSGDVVVGIQNTSPAKEPDKKATTPGPVPAPPPAKPKKKTCDCGTESSGGAH